MSDTFAIISIVLSWLSALFFLIGCLANSSSQPTVKGTAWIIYNEKIELTTGSNVVKSVHQIYWFGLKNYFYTFYNDDDKFDNESSHESYSSDACSAIYSFCDTCKSQGKNAVGLVAVALVFAVICGVLNMIIASSNQESTKAFKFLGVINSFLSFLLSLIGVCLFMGNCMDKIKDQKYVDSNGLAYGPGSIMVIIGIIFMIVTFICSMFNLFSSSQKSTLNEHLQTNQHPQQTSIPIVTANPIAIPVYVKN